LLTSATGPSISTNTISKAELLQRMHTNLSFLAFTQIIEFHVKCSSLFETSEHIVNLDIEKEHRSCSIKTLRALYEF